MTTFRLGLAGLILCATVYLFVSAPPELADAAASTADTRVVEVEKMFNAVNAINDAARTIYTKRIVGAGVKAGLKFGEDWAEPGVEKGPLPALFLRLTAQRLETKPPQLGLYLGSDEPINKSNLFSGPQLASFSAVKSQRAPVFLEAEKIGHVAMYPDIAGVQACVTCHNEHNDSPKIDWQLNDVMGATTWTYPMGVVPAEDYLAVVEAFYTSIEEAYGAYLDRASGFGAPILISGDWPAEGQLVLPSRDVFMAEVRAASAGHVLTELVLLENGLRQEGADTQ